VLKSETVALMGQNHVGDLEAGRLKSVVPEASADIDFFPGMSQKWGLSFLINKETSPFGRNAGSLSWGGLANTYFWIDSKADVGGLLMAQFLPFGDPKMLGLYELFEQAAYPRR
jgi:methyl acetate hydrolase